MKATTATLLAAALAATACGKKKDAKDQAPPAPEPPAAPAPPTTSAPPPTIPPTPGMLDLRDVGFASPASVLYVPAQDLYLVSNVNGEPGAADDNGFISQLAPDGVVRQLTWIDGAKPEVTLNAPRGMAVLGDKLYVADLTSVRIFDVATGAPKGAIAVEGSTFLDDIAAGRDRIYVGNIGSGDATKQGVDAIYAIDLAGEVTTIAAGAELAEPNGLAVIDGHVWVVPFGSKEMYRIHDGKKLDGTALPTGALDGLEALPDGRVVVSSWEGKALYIGKPGSGFVVLADGVDAPADLGFDRKRNRVMVPLLTSNAVRFYPVR